MRCSFIRNDSKEAVKPLTKERAKQLQRDFIPGGKAVNIRTLRFRRTESDEEVHQCCRQTSYDIQSGPIYCGKIAEYIADTADGHVALCEVHPPPRDLVDE